MKKRQKLLEYLLVKSFRPLGTLLILAVFIGCAPKISKQTALDIAKGYVQQDTLMTINFEERLEEVVNENGNWHVSFPLKPETNKVGGEPHFLIDKKTGEIIKSYYTR